MNSDWETILEIENTLKPCPFCGGKAEIIPTGNSTVGWKRTEVRCKLCGMTRTFRWITHNFDREFIWKKTAELWNRRIDDEVEVDEKLNDNVR